MGTIGALCVWILISGNSKAASKDCLQATYQELHETFDGTEITTYRVNLPDIGSETQRLEDSNHFHQSDILKNLDGITLGVERNGHAYILVNGWRLDAKPGFGRITQPGPVVTGGTLIHLKTSPELTREISSELARDPSRRPFSYHCYEGVCNLLRGHGIIPASDPGISATSILKAILKNGFIDAHDQPIEMTIVQTDERSLQHRYNNLVRNQNKTIKKMSVPVLTASAMVIVGSTIYYYFPPLQQPMPTALDSEVSEPDESHPGFDALGNPSGP